MKLAIFAPYGRFQRESGLIYLLANYLTKRGGEVVQFRCDGALAACGRDRKHPGGARSPFSCQHCMSEQGGLARWAGIRDRALSTYLSSEDNLQSAQWVLTATRDELARIEFRGARVWDVCAHEISSRWGIESPRDLSVEQERNVRALLLGYIHTVVAGERFLAAYKPTLSFVAGDLDPLSIAYISQAERVSGDVAIFSFRAEDETTVITNRRQNTQRMTTLVIQEVTETRLDPRTWPPEFKATVNEISSFLGYGEDLIPTT